MSILQNLFSKETVRTSAVASPSSPAFTPNWSGDDDGGQASAPVAPAPSYSPGTATAATATKPVTQAAQVSTSATQFPTNSGDAASIVATLEVGIAGAEDVLTCPLPDNMTECLRLLKRVQSLPNRLDYKWRALRDARERAIAWLYTQLCQARNIGTPRKQLGSRQKEIMAVIRRDCAKEIAELQVKDGEYHNLRKQFNADGILPGTAVRLIEEIIVAIGNATETSELDTLVARKTRLVQLAQTPNVGRAAVRLLNVKLNDMGKEVSALETAVEKSLSTLDAELVKAESEFFDAYGLPHQRTAVSAIVASVRIHLEGITDTYHRVIGQQDNFPAGDRILNLCASTFAELFE